MLEKKEGVAMNIVDRWNRICALVAERDYVTVDELVELLDSSPATIRRDLNSMEDEGLIERFRGGAKSIQKSYVSAFSMDKRLNERQDVKMSICRKAAALVEDGDYIYIDASSTTYFLADYITANNIVVITNSVLLLPKLLKKKINTYILGGSIEFESGSIIGEETLEKIKSMNFDKAFIGTYGIDLERGFTTYGTEEGELKRNLITQSKQVYVMADHKKFGVSAFFTFGKLEAATIITDSCDREFLHKGNILQLEDDKLRAD